MTEQINKPIHAHTLSSDWNHVRETTRMMELAIGQIEAAMTDSNASVEVLTDSFTTMAGYMRMIANTINELPDDGEVGELKRNTLEAANHVTGMVHNSIIAFQFYDKLAQRISHVSHSLAVMNELMDDRQRIAKPQEWVVLQEKIRAKYTTVDECAMFDAVMHGMSVHEALDHYKVELKDNDIDLF